MSTSESRVTKIRPGTISWHPNSNTYIVMDNHGEVFECKDLDLAKRIVDVQCKTKQVYQLHFEISVNNKARIYTNALWYQEFICYEQKQIEVNNLI